MKHKILERTENYFAEFERHLKLPEPRVREILDEARSDMLSLVSHYQEQGKTEGEAVDLALGELGDPASAGSDIMATVPPSSPMWLKLLRILAAVFVIFFGLCIFFTSYISHYNRGLLTALGGVSLLCFFLIPALLLWPGIIWRKNWLFSVIPAGAGLLGVVVMVSLGASQSTSLSMEIGEPNARSGIEPEIPGRVIDRNAIHLNDRTRPVSMPLKIASGMTILLFCYLVWFIQRKNQRGIVVALTLLTVIGFEIVFRIEESRFRKELYVRLDQREEQLNQAGFAPEDAEFRLGWKSSFIPGYNFQYSSSRNRLWILD